MRAAALLLLVAGCRLFEPTAKIEQWEDALEAARRVPARDVDAILSAYEALKPGIHAEYISLDWYDRERVAAARCTRGAAATDDARALDDLRAGVELGGCDEAQRARLRALLGARGLPVVMVRGL